MASKISTSVVLFLLLNILFSAMVTATPTPASKGKCPIDALKLGVCLNLLNGLVDVQIGTPSDIPCCSLISGLADLELEVCLCTTIKLKGLINLNLPIDLSLPLNACGKTLPTGFQCP
ncbi:hypothetical protein IFM89_018717 [Coptis chinensis]|uniref:Bifunctional inhibitor/plant lipid transfer protein/seed storage helical domain-containing protein n=1 Tax=Coptis chinensis TaxID=261450 RepID=A0A835M0K2_9MAGN|nr:hypothetical protein IFM89_018717 [Coptis chinensis]